MINGIFVAFISFAVFMGVVEAREIGEFSYFKITTRFARTGFLTKYNSNQYYVVNLEPSQNLSPMRVKNRLVNSNGENRSDEHKTTCGTRGKYGNWATGGYHYALEMARENWWDGPAYITGSWSPDTN